MSAAEHLLVLVTFYLLASSVLPDVEGDGPVDMRAHYFEHRTWFFLLAAFNIVLLIAGTLLREGSLLHPVQAFRGAFFLIFLALAWTENRRFHVAAFSIMLALVTLFIVRFALHIG